MLNLIFLLIVLILVAPVCFLVHEGGHIVAAKLVKASHIALHLGVGRIIWQGNWGSIHVTLRQFWFSNSYMASDRRLPYNAWETIFIAVMGPSFSLLLAVGLLGAYSFFGMTTIFYLLFWFNVWIGAVNLIPFKVGQKQSDGYTICKQMFHLK